MSIVIGLYILLPALLWVEIGTPKHSEKNKEIDVNKFIEFERNTCNKECNNFFMGNIFLL